MTEEELERLEEEYEKLSDDHYKHYLGTDKTRALIGWTDEKEMRFGYLQQLLFG